MNRRNFIIGASGAVTFAACAHVMGNSTLAPYHASPIAAEEREQTLISMKPPKRERPLIAVLADNHGSETTDFIIPWSILTQSDVADVYAVAFDKSPVQLMPALSIAPQLSTAEFSAQFPDGADYVIVPAFHNSKSPRALNWIQQQRSLKSSIVGICAGALPLAHAGLLENKRATTHWYSVNKLQKISPTTTWEKDRRYVADNGIITSTGVSASLPLALGLVEAIAGREKSDALASELGVSAYDARHNSEYFKLGSRFVTNAAANKLNILGREKIGIEIEDGVDELALALTADAWSRTYRSKAYTVGAAKTVKSLNGLVFNSDHQTGDTPKFDLSASIPNTPGNALVDTLDHIQTRYGTSTAANVALQLEFPWQG